MKTSWVVVWSLLLIAGVFAIYEWWYRGDDEDDIPQLPSSAIMQTDSAQLELKLEVGDRFPLMKTVKQELSQFTPQGLMTSRSELKLLLAITVEQVTPKGKLLSVRYESVKYSHDMAGETIEYDSNASRKQIPDTMRAYSGLVNNGFSFWIGQNNQLVELVGFDDFLKRCVRGVPPEEQQAVLHQMIASSGEEDIANFIDDSIGLLPFDADGGTTVAVGDSWTRERQILRPMPMFISTRYTLTELAENYAEVNITGDVTPSRTFGPSDQVAKEVILTVRGGQTFGTCTIDRRNGFPIKSQIERNLTMHVKMAGGVEFDQHKLTVTTIETFPQQPATAATHSLRDSNVVPATFEEGR